MIRLIIQIPSFNEQDVLLATLRELPVRLEGIDCIEILIIDDGSTDRTVEVARQAGVGHILPLGKHMGLATAFAKGLDYCVAHGADIIVNMDADNQYKAQDIPRLIAPILEGRADIVIGNRNIEQIPHFSPFKKLLQRFGSWTVKQLSGLDIPDATTGFRAYSASAAKQLSVYTKFSYTLETIICAGHKALRVANITVETNPDLRPSRLYGSMGEYVKKQAATLIRVYVMYQPFKFFLGLGGIFFIFGLILSLRYCYFFIIDHNPSGHVQSLIFAAVFLILGVQMFVLGLLADLMATNRRLMESFLTHSKKT